MNKLILIFTILFSHSATSEYRAYQYMVKSIETLPDKESVISSIVVSTLAPVSYVAYHGGNQSTTINLLNSWICPGDTSQKNICSSPQIKEGN